MYIEVTFYSGIEEEKEILMAKLSEFAEGFEDRGKTLIAIFTKSNYTDQVKELITMSMLHYDIRQIAEQNWNSLWESNFDPVIINNFVAIRADFHNPIQNITHEIIITPKMSFGTGHHATTCLMMQQMQEINFEGKSVFDFGTGTGILSILAHQLGAANIIATDIDSWSIENAAENFKYNNVNDVNLILSDDAAQGEAHDIILANINKNVLLQNIPTLSTVLKSNGILVISGFLTNDEEQIVNLCTHYNISPFKRASKNGWIVLVLNRL